jgi:type VI secretion system protein ImpK
MDRDARRPPVPDPELTLRMPAPGGEATLVMKRPPAPPAPHAGLELQRLVAGVNPLLGAASTLLALAEQLRHTGRHDDPGDLRRQLLQQVAEFETAAGAAGVPRPKVTAARYLLCSFLDEVIDATPWGAVSGERTLLQEFHEERSGAEKAFQLLERLGQDPADNADLLELFYVCLRLGFEGRYRGTRDGRVQLEAIAARVLEVVRPSQASTGARSLSEPAQGVAPHRHLEVTVLPLWLLALLTGGLLLGVFLFVGTRLDALAQPVFRQLLALPQALHIERGNATARARLAPLLQADLAQGALAVRDETLRSVITLPADVLFVAGSANVEAGQRALLQRVAQAVNQALQGAPGEVAVLGHTDDATATSLQFPSSWHLSHERARAVMAQLVQLGVPAARLRAEGRADVEPLQPNIDAAARARNRRIEVELRLTRPDAMVGAQ